MEGGGGARLAHGRDVLGHLWRHQPVVVEDLAEAELHHRADGQGLQDGRGDGPGQRSTKGRSAGAKL